MHHKDDGIWGATCGVIGGFGKWIYLQISAPGPQWSHIIEAGGTALMCGFLGAAGTHLYKYIGRAWRDYFNNKKSKNMAIKTSSFGSINWHDVLMSAAIAAGTAVMATAGQAITAWVHSVSFAFDMPTIILSSKAAAAAFLGTIIRALLASNRATITNLDDTVMQKLKSGQAQINIQSTPLNTRQ